MKKIGTFELSRKHSPKLASLFLLAFHILTYNSLPNDVLDVIKAVFADLSQTDLLKNRLYKNHNTQNITELLNLIIWSRIPNLYFFGTDTMVLFIMNAISTYNDGNTVDSDYPRAD